MKIYDFLCKRCGHMDERYVMRPEEPQYCRCGEKMHKLPPATPTTFRYMDKRKP